MVSEGQCYQPQRWSFPSRCWAQCPGSATSRQIYNLTIMFCRWLCRTAIFPSVGRAEETPSLCCRRITLESIWVVSIFHASLPSVLWDAWFPHSCSLPAQYSEVASLTVWDIIGLLFCGAFGGEKWERNLFHSFVLFQKISPAFRWIFLNGFAFRHINDLHRGQKSSLLTFYLVRTTPCPWIAFWGCLYYAGCVGG